MKRKLIFKFLAGAAAVSGLCATPMAFAKPAGGSDWLSLWTLATGSDGCTLTIKVDWAGFSNARTLEVFLTQGYTGAKLVPTYVNKPSALGGTATVTLPPLVPGTQYGVPTAYYPWAQMLDGKGAAIPASLDFGTQVGLYCAPPP